MDTRTSSTVHGLAVVVLALLLAAPGSAQRAAATDAATVAGVVFDSVSGAALPGARVLLVDGRQGTLSDSAGVFELRGVPIGHHRLAVHQYGYEERMLAFEVTAAEPGQLDVALSPSPVALEGFTVVAANLATMEQRLRSRRNATPVSVRAFEQERLLRSAAWDLRDFLSIEALLSVQPCGSRALSGSCVVRRGRLVQPRVYIDEAPVIGGLDQLQTYRPYELYLLEVYSSGSEIRAYTHQFMERMARRPMALIPILLW